MNEKFLELIIRVPAVLIALTVHEFAHGYMAWHRGDDTAKNQGRLTLNPLAHLDPIGTLMLMFAPIGWAKPVPVQPMNLANPRRDMVWVAAAGPLSNIVMAIGAGLLMKLLLAMQPAGLLPAFATLFTMVFYRMNLALAIFNLLPVPPLDGYNITLGSLPAHRVQQFTQAVRFLPQILFGMIILEQFGVKLFSSFVINPIFMPWFSIWDSLFGVRELFS